MDSALRDLMTAAAARGNKYVKGEATMAELPRKIAELGVMLLEKANRLSSLENAGRRDELIEIQNKLDDLRKSVFANKISAK